MGQSGSRRSSSYLVVCAGLQHVYGPVEEAAALAMDAAGMDRCDPDAGLLPLRSSLATHSRPSVCCVLANPGSQRRGARWTLHAADDRECLSEARRLAASALAANAAARDADGRR